LALGFNFTINSRLPRKDSTSSNPSPEILRKNQQDTFSIEKKHLDVLDQNFVMFHRCMLEKSKKSLNESPSNPQKRTILPKLTTFLHIADATKNHSSS